MARFTINPPNARLVDERGFIAPDWYRFFARVNDTLGDDVVGAMQAAPVLTYSPTTAFADDKVLTQGAGLSFTSGAGTLTVALSVSGVTASSYGSASQVATFTVDQYGRLTAAANVTITPAAIGAVPTSRALTAGAGLTGGGDLSADRAFDVGAGTGITVNANDVALDTAHARNVDHTAVTLTAGAGLTGGGDISSSRTFNIGAGTGITVNADDIALTVQTAHGTYTPTLTNVANLDASTAYACQYMRVGNTVTVSGKVDIDPTLTATATQLGISLPIASNFSAQEQCGGTAASSAIAGQVAAIRADTTNDRAELVYIAGDVTNQPMFLTFSYLVV